MPYSAGPENCAGYESHITEYNALCRRMYDSYLLRRYKAETKPTETKPTEAKPDEAKPDEAKQAIKTEPIRNKQAESGPAADIDARATFQAVASSDETVTELDTEVGYAISSQTVSGLITYVPLYTVYVPVYTEDWAHDGLSYQN